MRPLTHPALGFGFVVTALVTALGPVSGAHMNPAVTLAALLLGQLGALPALLYALAQLLGGALGFGVLVGTLPPHALRTLDSAGAVLGVHGCPAPAPGVPVWAAALVEALLTGLLVLVVCAVWAAHDAARPDHSVPLKLGVTIAGLVYAGVSDPTGFYPLRPAAIPLPYRARRKKLSELYYARLNGLTAFEFRMEPVSWPDTTRIVQVRI